MSQKPTSNQSPKAIPGESAVVSSTYDPVSSYRSYKIRYYTHQDILARGSAIHKKLVEELESEKQRCIQEAEVATWTKAELLKEEAVQHAFECALEEQKIFALKIEKQQELVVQEAVDKIKKEMNAVLESELKKTNEDATRRTNEEIQKILLICNKKKTEAIEQAKQQQRKIAFSAQVHMKKEFIQEHKEALELAAKKHQKSMQQLRDEKDLEMGLAVAVAQREEQEKVKEMLQKQEMKHQDQLEHLKEHLTLAEESHTLRQQQLVSSKEELEQELEETREAFQKYINLTFPQLPTGQADFILPFRQKMQEAHKIQESAGTAFEKQM